MHTLLGHALPNIPWENRPSDNTDVVWRYSRNPVIPRNIIPCANSVFNSAVVPFRNAFAGVFRVDDTSRNMRIHNGRSQDGFTFEIDPEPISWVCDDPEIGRFVESYDPRVVEIDGRFYVTWCNNYHGYTIGLGYTDDFKSFCQLENSFLPFNRNGVLFLRKINGKFAMLSRPSDTGNAPRSAPVRPRSKPPKAGCSSITACSPVATDSSITWAPPSSTATSLGKFYIAPGPTSSIRGCPTSASATSRTLCSLAPRWPMPPAGGSPSTTAVPTPLPSSPLCKSTNCSHSSRTTRRCSFVDPVKSWFPFVTLQASDLGREPLLRVPNIS